MFDGVTPYHWLVVIIASCGWLFDCMDQRLFILGARAGAARAARPATRSAAALIKTLSGYATTSMILGWATGGIIFGMMSDRLGRVKTMVVTLLIYSGFTGLSGLATILGRLHDLPVPGRASASAGCSAPRRRWWPRACPAQFRAMALGSLQALSALGNIIGSLVSLLIPPGAANFLGGYSGWRVLFFVGIVPALLIVPIMFVLKEPESWLRAKADAAAGGGSGQEHRLAVRAVPRPALAPATPSSGCCSACPA